MRGIGFKEQKEVNVKKFFGGGLEWGSGFPESGRHEKKEQRLLLQDSEKKWGDIRKL